MPADAPVLCRVLPVRELPYRESVTLLSSDWVRTVIGALSTDSTALSSG